MSTLQQRLAAIAETAANIKAQLRELDRLRDQVRKAQQSINPQAAETT
jgi:prefoldin subunit 5